MIAQRQHNPTEALEQIARALLVTPHDPALLLKRSGCLFALGQWRLAREAALQAKEFAPPNPRLFDAIGQALSRTGDQAGALAAYEEAGRLAPNEPHFAFNRATARRYLGDLEGAEADYDRVLARRPEDYEAQLNRSQLRKQLPERNHITTLEALLATGRAGWAGEVALRYALAKEHEDLGQYERSFAHLTAGARLRREHLSYDVAQDVATVDSIIRFYPEIAPPPTALSPNSLSPIFIVGLPRSGSTLVERILGCHPAVQNAGELPHFALALVSATSCPANRRPTREDRVAQSTRLDFAALGKDYLARVRACGFERQRFTDKMPLNYLYCGLIRRALPDARIVHVRRDPMAACYAIYKTLFQTGYPFSYDLRELGRYYVAYRRLMRHWADTLPGTIHELRYEDLIADSRRVTRVLLDFCGLNWNDACTDPMNNTVPVTTASAAQVRQPLYDTSIAQWRHYEGGLSQLAGYLRSEGLLDG